MKLANTQIANKKPGVTLLELTVVILVLLTLIGILFVGVNAWRKGSDRAANILNVRNTSQAMRGFQNTRLAAVGDAFANNAAAGLLAYMRTPVKPTSITGAAYAFADVVQPYTSTVAPIVTVPNNLYITGPVGLVVPAAAAVAGEYHSAASEVTEW